MRAAWATFIELKKQWGTWGEGDVGFDFQILALQHWPCKKIEAVQHQMPPQDLRFCWRDSVFDEGMTVPCAANSAWVCSPYHKTPAHHTCPSDFVVDTSWSEKERMTQTELVLDCWLSPSASWQKGVFGKLMDPLWGSWCSWCLCTTLDGLGVSAQWINHIPALQLTQCRTWGPTYDMVYLPSFAW